MRIIDEIIIQGDRVILSYGGIALEPPKSPGDTRDDEFIEDAVRARANLTAHDEIDTEEYPDKEKLIRPSDEFAYHYVATSYLNGIVNCTSHVKTIGVRRYMTGRTVDESKMALEDSLSQNDFCHANHDDDIILIRESASHYWAMLYGKDGSDCSIVRARKWRGVNFVIGMLQNGYLHKFDSWEAVGKPNGWIH